MEPTIALSSGEAELAAVVRGAAELLGLRSVFNDFVGREGLGKVRHLATAGLWIQQRVRRGELSVAKWPGEKNPADLCTKGLSPEATSRHLAAMGFVAVEGRAAAAPALKAGAGRTSG